MSCNMCSKTSGLCPVSVGLALGLTAVLGILVMLAYGVVFFSAQLGDVSEFCWMLGGTFLRAFAFGLVFALIYNCIRRCCKARCCKQSTDGVCGCGNPACNCGKPSIKR